MNRNLKVSSFLALALLVSCKSEITFDVFSQNLISVATPLIEINGPTPLEGDDTTEFTYSITMANINNFELKSSHIELSEDGSSCSSKTVIDGNTPTPKIKISGCTGNGSIEMTLNISDELPADIDIPKATEFSVAPNYTYRNDILALANNRSSCAINSSNELKCWGSNYDSDDNVNGLLGTNDSTNSYETSFQDVDSLNKYTQVTRGEVVGCAIREDKQVYCWGKSWSVGDSSNSLDIRVPRKINDNDTYISIQSGSYHTCAITEDHEVKCWGDSWGSKLGRGGSAGDPLVSDSGTKYQQISAGRNHTCGITLDKKLKCFGYNNNGQIGVGNTVSPQAPSIVDPTTDYEFISSQEDVTCAITTTGVLKCWGSNSEGLLGQGTSGGNITSPTIVDSGQSYKKVDVGFRHVCAITTDQRLKCWGRNSQGQVGDGTTTGPVLSPKLIDASNMYKVVSAGLLHSCAIRINDDLYCWGNNSQGDLGDGTTTIRTSPTLIQSNL